MHVFHGVKDIYELDGPTFFGLAYRLPAYEGASRLDLEGWLEEVQEEAQREPGVDYPPRYVDENDEEIRAKEGRVNTAQVQQPQPVEREDRAATLEELVAAGPAMPIIGQIAPIFEVGIPPKDS